jgi:nicotinamide phosphoribosyltransferase
MWGTELKDRVLNSHGTLVVRPDSGDPLEVLPRVLQILESGFGCKVNSRGYKILNDKVRVIQGDGIDFDTMTRILIRLKDCGWSTDNIAFGSGGGLLQKLNRDTLAFAFKCSSTTINDKQRDVYKDPITSSGKKSKRGRLRLIKDKNGQFKTVRENEWVEGRDELVEVFRDGDILREYNLSEVRERASI